MEHKTLFAFLGGAITTFLLVNLLSNNPLAPSLVSSKWCSQMQQMHQTMMGGTAMHGGQTMMNTGMMNSGAWGFPGFMTIGWVLSIFFWIAVLWLIWWAVTNRDRLFSPTQRNPLDLAKERYAKGEISKRQFEEIKKELT